MQLAVAAVKAGTKYAEAARRFGIPRQTIANRVQGKYLLPVGRPRVLNQEQEAELCRYITDCDALGDQITPKQLRKAAGKLAVHSTRKFKNKIPAHTFVKNLLKRYSRFSKRKPQPLSRAAANVTPFDIQDNIRKIRAFLIEKGFQNILTDSRAFANADETGYVLNPTPKIVIAPKGSKAYRVETSKPKQNVSVLHCILASGESMKPQLILEESDPIVDVARACGEVGANFVLQQTKKGWQSKKSFGDYMKTKFIAELDEMGVIRRPDYPFVLFLDNHQSHKDPELFKWCRENHIILCTFFPNSTHVSQPLDVGVFGAVKKVYGTRVEEWRGAQKNRELKLADFVKILFEVEKQAFTRETIKNAFRGTGVYPLDEKNIHTERCIAPNRPQSTPMSVSEAAEFDEDISDVTLNSNDDVQNSSNEIPDEIVFCDVTEKLQNMKRLAEELELEFQTDPEKLMMCNIIKQQIRQLSAPSSSNSALESASLPLTAAGSLPRPASISRPIQERRQKFPTHGVMTSDEVIKKHQDLVDEKAKQQEEKENRQADRLKQREISLTIKNMKKEQTVEKKKRKAEELEAAAGNPKKPRGRPKKVANAEKDEEWQPLPLSQQNPVSYGKAKNKK